MKRLRIFGFVFLLLAWQGVSSAVEVQPLAANVQRLAQALDFLGAPFAAELRQRIADAAAKQDADLLQQCVDAQALAVVTINPEGRVKATRGAAAAALQQHGYTPVVIKVINQGGVTAPLRLSSSQAGPVYAGVARPNSSLERQQQLHLLDDNKPAESLGRFLDIEVFSQPPMTATLSGLEVEYVIALLLSTEAGKREATLVFDTGQGTQDLGFRAELPVLFSVSPAVPVKLAIKDCDGTPTVARLQFQDAQGHVFPPQPKRLLPDFFFQKHIYRKDGESILLPAGKLMMWSGRGPEYHWRKREIEITPQTKTLEVQLERWVNPADFGFYSGDHHIHPAGCAHYTSPSEGASPEDMFRQIKGEALNVACVLNWAFCFGHQQQFFAAQPDQLSEPFTVMKYDIEVSGFGSAQLGHLCLLNLQQQIYPGADGVKGWPTWTLPILRWARSQGVVAGYAHSASGMQIDPLAASQRLIARLDTNHDGALDEKECAGALLPEPFATIDADHDGSVSLAELTAAHNRVADQLPNLANPEITGGGATEIFVTAALGQCDFISAMDTPRIAEWNSWYHLMNCGLPVKVSGETDFPCMSGTRVGQGRSYVKLGKVSRVDFKQWCEGIRAGRSYASDGYAHALDFQVDGKTSGDELRLDAPRKVHVTAKVAFSGETPLEVEYGNAMPTGGSRLLGDTVHQHPLTPGGGTDSSRKLVEIVVNGEVKAKALVPADSQAHDVAFDVPIEGSSWIALRQFPQLHTNPVTILVAGKPIRSQKSAQWCLECIDQLWRQKEKNIIPAEREAARSAYEEARKYYRAVKEEALQ
jgi:hypothetical protein